MYETETYIIYIHEYGEWGNCNTQLLCKWITFNRCLACVWYPTSTLNSRYFVLTAHRNNIITYLYSHIGCWKSSKNLLSFNRNTFDWTVRFYIPFKLMHDVRGNIQQLLQYYYNISYLAYLSSNGNNSFLFSGNIISKHKMKWNMKMFVSCNFTNRSLKIFWAFSSQERHYW